MSIPASLFHNPAGEWRVNSIAFYTWINTVNPELRSIAIQSVLSELQSLNGATA